MNTHRLMLLPKTLISASMLLFLGAATAGPDKSQLIGKWKMQSASIEFPDACKSMTLQFLADGTYVGDDGSMVMTMKFDIVDDGEGLVLDFSPSISDNGHENCQWLSPEYIRQHPLRKSLVRFVDNGKTMRFYFGATEQRPYVVLMRQE